MNPTIGTFILAVAGIFGSLGPTAASSSPQLPNPETMKAALERAAEGRWDRLRLLTECRDGSKWRAVEVFGSGVGLWAGDRQFQLPKPRLLELLRALRDADFGSMPDRLEGGEDPKTPKFAKKVVCRVELALDGLSKSVAQLDRGRQSPELRALAHKIFDLTEDLGREGITASSLTDGLKKIAAGELAPEVLSLTVNRRPSDQAQEAGEAGWLLRIQHGEMTVAPSRGAEGYGPEARVPLSAGQARGLAELLVENQAAELPVNLYSPHYTDFSVEVMNWGQRLQAREFAGMTRETHGVHQARFESIFAEIEKLALADRAGGE